MKNQNKNIHMWFIGLSFLSILIIAFEVIIAHNLYPNEPEAFRGCCINMILITLFAYIIVGTILSVQCVKFEKEYKRNKVEKAKQELTSEFKTVFINNSGIISKDMIECTAKVDENGKIICKIHCDFKTELETYEDFLRCFHFDEE